MTIFQNIKNGIGYGIEIYYPQNGKVATNTSYENERTVVYAMQNNSKEHLSTSDMLYQYFFHQDSFIHQTLGEDIPKDATGNILIQDLPINDLVRRANGNPELLIDGIRRYSLHTKARKENSQQEIYNPKIFLGNIRYGQVAAAEYELKTAIHTIKPFYDTGGREE